MHESVGNLAAGVPHESSGEIDFSPLFTAAGTLGSFLDQKYTYAPSAVVLLSTYHPPPALLNPGPYELGVVKLFPQPWLPFTAALQSRDVGVLCFFACCVNLYKRNKRGVSKNLRGLAATLG